MVTATGPVEESQSPPIVEDQADPSVIKEREEIIQRGVDNGSISEEGAEIIRNSPAFSASNPYASILFSIIEKLVDKGAKVEVAKLENNNLRFTITLDGIEKGESAALSKFLGTVAAAAVAAGAGFASYKALPAARSGNENIADPSTFVANTAFTLVNGAGEFTGTGFQLEKEEKDNLARALQEVSPEFDLEFLNRTIGLLGRF
jgi:hypothetical protein